MTQAGTAGIHSARRVSCRHQLRSAGSSQILAVKPIFHGQLPRRTRASPDSFRSPNTSSLRSAARREKSCSRRPTAGNTCSNLWQPSASAATDPSMFFVLRALVERCSSLDHHVRRSCYAGLTRSPGSELFIMYLRRIPAGGISGNCDHEKLFRFLMPNYDCSPSRSGETHMLKLEDRQLQSCGTGLWR